MGLDDSLELLLPLPCRPDANVGNLSAGKQRGSLMIHRSGNPLMAEIGRLKKENDVKLVCLKRENKLKGLF